VVGPREALWCKRALLDGWSCGSCGVDMESWHGDVGFGGEISRSAYYPAGCVSLSMIVML
jgi:hypothetical protein